MFGFKSLRIRFFFQEEKLREYRREKRKEKKGGIETSGSGSGFDSDMAAVMGFSGFGTSSKKN